MKRLIFVFAALAFLAGAGALAAENRAYEPLNPEAPGAAGRRTPIVAAIEKARPAVVSVYAQVSVRGGSPFQANPFYDDFFNRFFEDMWRPRARQGTTLGSGVVIDGAEGLVVTNEHVVRNASSLTVTLTDGRELQAEVLGADPRFDLAVLKVKGGGRLPELRLGDSGQLMIGETVIAIGNPFGLSHTATTGVVSATGRTMAGTDQTQHSLHDLIQTDASINPGNSGGPLLNINGEVIGINTAILARGEGLGFAIPSDQVRRITARLRRGERQAALDLGLELAESGRPRRGETGCLVISVVRGGPADAAGVRKGDQLMTLDGSPTSTVADYEMILSSLSPGREVKGELKRGERAVSVALRPKAFTEAEALEMVWRLYGLKVDEQRGRLALQRPAAGSPAAELGLREGDLLLSFGGRELATRADLSRAMLDSRFQSAVTLAVQRGRTIYQITLDRMRGK